MRNDADLCDFDDTPIEQWMTEPTSFFPDLGFLSQIFSEEKLCLNQPCLHDDSNSGNQSLPYQDYHRPLEPDCFGSLAYTTFHVQSPEYTSEQHPVSPDPVCTFDVYNAGNQQHTLSHPPPTFDSSLKESVTGSSSLIVEVPFRKASHSTSGIFKKMNSVVKIKNKYEENRCNTVEGEKTFPSERSHVDLSKYTNTPEDLTRALLLLGSTLRSKADNFIDVGFIADPLVNRRAEGDELFFPDRLYNLLELSEQRNWTHIISFQSHGRSFRVHDKRLFIDKLLPFCLRGKGSWSSFLRQLRLYGFTRCESGFDYSAYYHELFLRGRPSLTRYMRRVGISHGGLDRRTFRLKEGKDPNFYEHGIYIPMPPFRVSS